MFDARARSLIDADGVAIPLTPMELDLVAAFAARPGQVIGRDELLDLAPPGATSPSTAASTAASPGCAAGWKRTRPSRS
ncbi:hypothetical protein [Mesorhizobium sp. M9A.F.Ca.ET.002.03.1.2]|uniref:winged helix-turn-helix domain-containing protein n=1 Tax=Mesorhizobium sp. M9A.F.Ca.ET.002.03.1.2 TaxID=2493668 RepID=UPI001FE1A249|nr:hypothetical protein [Mesorhizobium sp. M9A.F.Ca.ET.002.03.1.2]